MATSLLICTGMGGFVIVLIVLVVVLRYLNYRENLALAEKGILPAERVRKNDGKDSLRWGILVSAVGLALTLGLLPVSLSAGRMILSPLILLGLLPLFFGLGLILIYVISKPAERKVTIVEPAKEIVEVKDIDLNDIREEEADSSNVQ